jgi:hypothetical protein
VVAEVSDSAQATVAPTTTRAASGTPSPPAPAQNDVIATTSKAPVALSGPGLNASSGQQGIVEPGAVVQIGGSEFKSNSPITLTLHSTPRDIGQVTTDDAGQFAVNVHLPIDLEPGIHRIEAAGVDAWGQPAVTSVRFFLKETGASTQRSSSSAGVGHIVGNVTDLPIMIGGGVLIGVVAASLAIRHFVGRRGTASSASLP